MIVPVIEAFYPREQNNENITPILPAELVKAIKSINKEKVSGPDQIGNEILKTCAESLVEPLTVLFNKIIDSENVPAQWYLAEIIVLQKKGAQNDIHNYRPI